jgi:hypothetical protein
MQKAISLEEFRNMGGGLCREDGGPDIYFVEKYKVTHIGMYNDASYELIDKKCIWDCYRKNFNVIFAFCSC